MADINLKLKIDSSGLKKFYSGLEKTIYEGIPRFYIDELDFNLQFNVPVVTGALKRSLDFRLRPYRPGSMKIADFQMLYYGIPVEERRGFIARSQRESYASSNRILTNAISYGFGGRLR